MTPILFALLLLFDACARARADSAAVSGDSYPGDAGYANEAGDAAHPWHAPLTPDLEQPLDEAAGGRTARGTPLDKRGLDAFPAEWRDIFKEMDKVRTPQGLTSLDFDSDGDGSLSDAERDAVRGRNTWMLWGGGNEAFWGWLQEQGYGFTDFLVLIDSRKRASRFRDSALINEPGFVQGTERVLGLWIDQVGTGGAGAQCQAAAIEPSPRYTRSLPFTPEDTELRSFVSKLPRDELDPLVYGYPSGVVGLRLFPNPDFFAKTDAAHRSRQLWRDTLIECPKPKADGQASETKEQQAERCSNAYYDGEIADPNLVRPLRVAMACAYCHVGPHPLNPPADLENPCWEHLSSTIGNQYWSAQRSFGALLSSSHFLHHLLRSQLPGTIDTSLISTDHINNANAINALFDLPARLRLAKHNPPERQSAANLAIPSLEEVASSVTPRRFPRVLLDGADSIGAFGAFLRVPVNIGTYSELWLKLDNPILGFAGQRPFDIRTAQTNSVYWQINERQRVPYMAKFFTHQKRDISGVLHSSTGPMKLEHTPLGARIVEHYKAEAARGREVFIEHCALCHSSKQPAGFALTFAAEVRSGWARAPAPSTATEPYVLPDDYAHWDEFKQSPGYAHYLAALKRVYEPDPEGFFEANYLSTDLRIPVTLVGTNAARAMGSNATRGQVWEQFSSDDYKQLPRLGRIRFYNPFSGRSVDRYGNNDSFQPPGGGVGYYRPPSLIGLWATAPYLHTNALGVYDPDWAVPRKLQTENGMESENGKKPPLASYDERMLDEHLPVTLGHRATVESRVAAFEDGITKLLWHGRRSVIGRFRSRSPVPGDLRSATNPSAADASASHDPGLIYRLPEAAGVSFKSTFIRPLLLGILGEIIVAILECWLWVAAAVLCALVALFARGRHGGTLASAVALILFLLVGLAVAEPEGNSLRGLLANFGRALALPNWGVALGLVSLSALAWFLLHGGKWADRAARALFGLLALAAVGVGVYAHRAIRGELGDLRLHAFPRGVPVNLVMNLNPSLSTISRGGLAITTALVRGWRRRPANENENEAYDQFVRDAGKTLIEVSKCPDYVLDRGHWFGESLSDDDKNDLIAFLRTL